MKTLNNFLIFEKLNKNEKHLDKNVPQLQKKVKFINLPYSREVKRNFRDRITPKFQKMADPFYVEKWRLHFWNKDKVIWY